MSSLYKLLLLTVICLVLAGCGEKPLDDEELLEQIVKSMATALEEKDRTGVTQHLAKDFIGQQRLRRVNVDGLLRLHFRQNKNIHVLVSDFDISVEQGEAEVLFKALAAGTSSLLPERGRFVQVNSRWQKREGEWKMVQADWQDVIEPDNIY